MDLISLALLAIAFVGWGSAAAVLVAKWMPQPVAELAGQHGRFTGLGDAAAGVVPYRKHVYQEAMNVVGTSN